MRSRSLSPLIGSETQPLHPGGQWPAQAELTDESTVPLEPQQRKGTAKTVSCLTCKSRREILSLNVESRYTPPPPHPLSPNHLVLLL